MKGESELVAVVFGGLAFLCIVFAIAAAIGDDQAMQEPVRHPDYKHVEEVEHTTLLRQVTEAAVDLCGGVILIPILLFGTVLWIRSVR